MANPDFGWPPPIDAARSGRRKSNLPGYKVPRLVQWGMYVIVAVLFVGILALRGGPGAVDASDVVVPTTALSHGHIGAAYPTQVDDPNPPGYALFAAVFVATLRPFIGASNWCVRISTGCLNATTFVVNSPSAKVRWYRSQALVAVLAWLVLEAGLIVLMHALGRDGTVVEAVSLLIVAVTPAVTDALVSAYHPQDLLCLGLIALGVAAALRDRWLVSGVVLGAALLSKQFALLALIPLVVAAPNLRKRIAVGGAAAVTVAVVLFPFVASSPSPVIHSLGATGILQSETGLTRTVLGIADVFTPTRYAIARYAPLLCATAFCVVARRRERQLRTAATLIGLITACLATRLVFEVAIWGYYLLAVSIFLVCLDCAKNQWPVRSGVWIALTSVWWQGWMPGSLTRVLNPLWLLGAAVTAIWIGLDELRDTDVVRTTLRGAEGALE